MVLIRKLAVPTPKFEILTSYLLGIIYTLSTATAMRKVVNKGAQHKDNFYLDSFRFY